MRRVAALVRASLLTAASYRLSLVVSIGVLLFQIVPAYYIGHTLQPFMAPSIAHEGSDYFSFLVIGTAAYLFVAAGVDALPRAIESATNTGTLEALFTTPTSTGALLVGLSGYQLLWTAVRAIVFLIAASVLGAQLAWSRFLSSAVVMALLMISYFAVGMVVASAIIAFRRAGPVQLITVVGSGLLGGVTFPTSMVPTWVHRLTEFVPLTYGLRALRRLVIDGRRFNDVAGDVGVLLLFATVGLAVASVALVLSLRSARRAGALAHY